MVTSGTLFNIRWLCPDKAGGDIVMLGLSQWLCDSGWRGDPLGGINPHLVAAPFHVYYTFTS
ncbi:hypothetical protein Raf01_41340 [Rugosimonospora africana]|uniref:Uncharacterized protein n=1 Tax=Rugosimonospora africana TaxID=556532 RepID=A0A8J3QTS7_9ACTN|nr:hypothetical protein Raf01_41340 [Rugosimonospora africana]